MILTPESLRYYYAVGKYALQFVAGETAAMHRPSKQSLGWSIFLYLLCSVNTFQSLLQTLWTIRSLIQKVFSRFDVGLCFLRMVGSRSATGRVENNTLRRRPASARLEG